MAIQLGQECPLDSPLVTFFNLPHQDFDAAFRWELKSPVVVIERLADLDP